MYNDIHNLLGINYILQSSARFVLLVFKLVFKMTCNDIHRWGVPASGRTSELWFDMAAALRFSRSGCPCTDPDEEQFPAVLIGGALPCEFELSTAGDVEWLLFSYT